MTQVEEVRRRIARAKSECRFAAWRESGQEERALHALLLIGLLELQLGELLQRSKRRLARLSLRNRWPE